jgi:hypothetical protein
MMRRSWESVNAVKPALASKVQFDTSDTGEVPCGAVGQVGAFHRVTYSNVGDGPPFFYIVRWGE